MPTIEGKGGKITWDPGEYDRTSDLAWRDGKLYQRWEHNYTGRIQWVEVRQLDPGVSVTETEEAK